jgi:C4-dicarboxylate-binding protein DctP
MPAAVSRRIFEVQRYMTVANYSTAQFVVQGNLAWWSTLSPEHQDVVTRAGLYAEAWIRDNVAEAESEAQQIITDSGVEVYILNAEERREFQEMTAPARDIFTRNTGGLGVRLLEIADSID